MRRNDRAVTDPAEIEAFLAEEQILRIAFYDDGELYTDRCYIQNMKNAKAAGLKIGIYWHAEESTKDEVLASTKYLLDVLDGGERAGQDGVSGRAEAF